MSDLEMLLRDAIGRIDAPVVPTDQVLAAGHRRVRRARTRAVAVAAVVALIAGGAWAGLSLADRDDSAPVIDRKPLSWSDRAVPWVDGQGVHFGKATMSRPDDLVRVVATLDAAFVQTSTGLTRLGRDGSTLELGPVVGAVQADPFGHFAAWATQDQVKAVDTRGGGLDVDAVGWMVTSVRGSTATVVEQGQSFALDLEGGGREPIDRAGGVRVIGLTDDWILGSQELVSRHGFQGDTVVPPWTERAFDASGAHLATRSFSPSYDGTEVVGDLEIMDLGTRIKVKIVGLEGRPDKIRWDPEGELIVRAVTGDSVRYYTCTVQANCRAIGEEIPLAQADGPEIPDPSVFER